MKFIVTNESIAVEIFVKRKSKQKKDKNFKRNQLTYYLSSFEAVCDLT